MCFKGTHKVNGIEGDTNIYFNDGRSLRLESGRPDICVPEKICSFELVPLTSHSLSGQRVISKGINIDRRDFKTANRKFEESGKS